MDDRDAVEGVAPPGGGVGVRQRAGVYHPGGLISARVRSIPASGIGKFFDLLASMEGGISLGGGEPDFATPWHIREAAIYSLERGYTMYTSNYGLLELREEVARHLADLYGVRYEPRDELLITAGVSEALDLALRARRDPGDEVIMTDPCYVAYRPCTVLAGGQPVPVLTVGGDDFQGRPAGVEGGGPRVRVLTVEGDDFQVRPAAIEAAITPRTKVLLLGSPSNPTGAVMAREELLGVAAVAAKHNLTVVADEIYDRLVYDGTHTCFAALPGMRERTILLGGLSKAYAMTGWRVGFAAGDPEIIEAMMKVHQYTLM